MSATIPEARGFEPTPYLQGVPLPVFGRVDLAVIQTLPLVGAGTTLTYTVKGAYVDVPLALTATYTADANVGNRNISFAGLDANGNTVWFIKAPTAQTATQAITYALTDAISTAFTSGFTQQMPIPSVPLLPASMVQAAVGGSSGAGDAWSAATITVIRIPTGPALVAQTATTVATPVLT